MPHPVKIFAQREFKDLNPFRYREDSRPSSLKISNPNDVQEAEADRVADKVMLMPEFYDVKSGIKPSGEPMMQRKHSDTDSTMMMQLEEEEDTDLLQMQPEIQKQGISGDPNDDESENNNNDHADIQLKSTGSNSDQYVSQGIQSRLNSTSGNGESLPPLLQREMESKMGQDLSGVRIHNYSVANEMSSELNAKAFTHGNDIYFKTGEYNPESSGGKRLLAHELAHTVQQGSNSDKNIKRDNKIQRTPELEDSFSRLPEDFRNHNSEFITAVIALGYILSVVADPSIPQPSRDSQSHPAYYSSITDRNLLNMLWDFFKAIWQSCDQDRRLHNLEIGRQKLRDINSFIRQIRIDSHINQTTRNRIGRFYNEHIQRRINGINSMPFSTVSQVETRGGASNREQRVEPEPGNQQERIHTPVDPERQALDQRIMGELMGEIHNSSDFIPYFSTFITEQNIIDVNSTNYQMCLVFQAAASMLSVVPDGIEEVPTHESVTHPGHWGNRGINRENWTLIWDIYKSMWHPNSRQLWVRNLRDRIFPLVENMRTEFPAHWINVSDAIDRFVIAKIEYIRTEMPQGENPVQLFGIAASEDSRTRFWNSRARTEGAQPISYYELGSVPVSEQDPSILRDLETFRSLQLPDSIIRALKRRLGMDRTQTRNNVITRELITELRRFIEQEVPETDEIWNEQIIQALNLGNTIITPNYLVRLRGLYRTSEIWRLSPEQWSDYSQRLSSVFTVGESGINHTQITRRWGSTYEIVITYDFALEVVNWQIWNRQREDVSHFGFLDIDDLEDLGIIIITPEEISNEPTNSEETTEVQQQESSTETVSEPQEEEYGFTDEDIEEFRVLRNRLNEGWETWRNSHANRNERDNETLGRLNTVVIGRIQEICSQRSVPEPSITHYPRVHVFNQHLAREVIPELIAQGPQETHGEGGTVRRGTPIRRLHTSNPAVRMQPVDMSIEEAMDELRSFGILSGQSTLVAHNEGNEGWNIRTREGSSESTRVVAAERQQAFTSLRDGLQQHLDAIDRGITLARGVVIRRLQTEESSMAPLRNALNRFFNSGIGNTVTTPSGVRVFLSNQFRTEWQRRGSLENLDNAQIFTRGNNWRRWIRNEIRLGESSIQRQEQYQSQITRTTRYAVQVDLHRSGVDVLRYSGAPFPIEQMHLDPVFAVALYRYLVAIRRMGVTKLWTAGLIRAPMSAPDVHAIGQAIDIWGYEINNEWIHLRSGLPVSSGSSNYLDTRHGHSDWFDRWNRIGDRTHQQIIMGLFIMTGDYFGKSIGPGHDQRHNSHFHCELYGNVSRGPQLSAIMNTADLPDYLRTRLERVERDEHE